MVIISNDGDAEIRGPTRWCRATVQPAEGTSERHQFGLNELPEIRAVKEPKGAGSVLPGRRLNNVSIR